MGVKLLTEHNLEFLSLTGGCAGLSASTYVQMLHCWKLHVAAQLSFIQLIQCKQHMFEPLNVNNI